MRKSGLAIAGSIQLPVMENADEEVRANGVLAQTATAGMENIATEKLDILEPLRANMVMSQAGATYLTGLVGNISIPAYTGSNVLGQVKQPQQQTVQVIGQKLNYSHTD